MSAVFHSAAGAGQQKPLNGQELINEKHSLSCPIIWPLKMLQVVISFSLFKHKTIVKLVEKVRNLITPKFSVAMNSGNAAIRQ